MWKSRVGGPVSWVMESLGIYKAGQTVLARLMESYGTSLHCVGRV